VNLLSLLVPRIGKPLALAILIITPTLLIFGSLAGMYYAGWNARDRIVEIEAKEAQLVDLRVLLADADYNARLVGDYVLRRAETTVEYRTIRERIPHVTTHFISAPGPPDAPPVLEPLPRCVFTDGFVSVWNDALLDDSGRAAAAAAGAEAAESLLDSGVTQQQILTNHVDNAEIDTAVRQQCTALIAAVKERQRQ
jgi:hypothetical protein